MKLFFLFVASQILAADQSPQKGHSWLLPWEPGTTYTYQWYLTTTTSSPGQEPNGITNFTLSWEKKTKGFIVSKGDLTFRGPGSLLKGRFYTLFQADLRPLFYVSRFGGAVAGRRTGGAGVNAFFAKKEVRIRLGTSAKSPVERLPLPKEKFWLYGHQAIQHWAVFCSFLDVRKKTTLRVVMPDILRFFNVQFEPEGKEELHGLPCTRLRFKAEELFTGKVWIGPDHRLIRYQQELRNGSLDIWLKLD